MYVCVGVCEWGGRCGGVSGCVCVLARVCVCVCVLLAYVYSVNVLYAKFH